MWILKKHVLIFESLGYNCQGGSSGSIGETHGRKVVDDSRNIIDLVKNPNKFSVMIVGIVLVLILIIVLLVVLIRKLIKKRRRRKK